MTKPPLLLIATACAGLVLALSGCAASLPNEFDADASCTLRGNVKFDGSTIGGAIVTVTGPDFEARVATSPDGKWVVGLPGDGAGTFTVALEEGSAPAALVTQSPKSIDDACDLLDFRVVNYLG